MTQPRRQRSFWRESSHQILAGGSAGKPASFRSHHSLVSMNPDCFRSTPVTFPVTKQSRAWFFPAASLLLAQWVRSASVQRRNFLPGLLTSTPPTLCTTEVQRACRLLLFGSCIHWFLVWLHLEKETFLFHGLYLQRSERAVFICRLSETQLRDPPSLSLHCRTCHYTSLVGYPL